MAFRQQASGISDPAADIEDGHIGADRSALRHQSRQIVGGDFQRLVLGSEVPEVKVLA
jgi:hypothetical protein